MIDRRLEFECWRRGRVPRLSRAQRVMLEAVELAENGALFRKIFSAGGLRWHVDATNTRKAVLRRLIGMGLVEVMGAGPARYRLTRLGRLTRELRG